ncbi:MFS transporter [Aurantiacibacter sp. MUD11]|uniref:MFS transporter n=1 Tax=Aurantiacibacter sp. MUD11 TaxID=3003265 RepID=UPI0022AB38A1|nr:MFS transporter [Aurantiacibacter sp. MUD11]WAT17902.1 MFS transporter [Aurantiacibacter sp. MUD11]
MTETAAASRWILSQNSRLRLFTLFILYVAQGVPIGLFWTAIPAWMAANGAPAVDIAYVLGLTALPWTLKLVNGFIMDRYTFLAMGRRRAWITGAQCVMITLLIVCAVVQPGVEDVLLLGIAGFAVNMATTFQDVAVDGLAVDIMEEDERARASGMMFGGQYIGIAAATGITGAAIAAFGPSAAYLLAAGFITLITGYVLFLRERPGERRLPWSAGEAHQRNREIHLGAWWPIMKNTFKSLLLPASLLWLPVLLVRGFHYGMFNAVTPYMGANNLGWDEAAITATAGSAQLLAGILGLTLGGWLGDRFGAKRTTIAFFIGYMLFSGTMLATQDMWADSGLFIFFVYGWYALDILLTVAALPISMRLCDSRVAATQFTIYMACSNLGITIGASVFGLFDRIGGLPTMFAIVMSLHLVGLLVMVLAKFPRRAGFQEKMAEVLAEAPGPAPRVN